MRAITLSLIWPHAINCMWFVAIQVITAIDRLAKLHLAHRNVQCIKQQYLTAFMLRLSSSSKFKGIRLAKDLLQINGFLFRDICRYPVYCTR